MSPSTILQQRESPRASFSSKSLCDTERLEALEQMAKRFTGIENPSRAQLHQALERLSDGDHQNSFAIPAVARGGDHPVFELQRRGSEDESKSGGTFEFGNPFPNKFIKTILTFPEITLIDYHMKSSRVLFSNARAPGYMGVLRIPPT